MRRRLFAIIMALTMVISILPATAMAEDLMDPLPDNNTETQIDSVDLSETEEGEAKSLPEPSDGDITLTEDVTLAKSWEVTAEATITLDLNGFTLRGPESGPVIKNYGSLTIKDSGTSGTITGSRGVDNYGTLMLESGAIHGTSSSFATIQFCAMSNTDTASFTMTGGTVTSLGTNAIGFTMDTIPASTTITLKGGTVGGILLKGNTTLTVGESSESLNHSKITVGAITTFSNKRHTHTLNLYNGIIEKLPKLGSMAPTVTYGATTALIVDDSVCPDGYHFDSVEFNDITYYQLEANTKEVAALYDQSESPVNTATYYSVLDAVDDLQEGYTLKLLSDYAIVYNTQAINIQLPNITLDLNGHSITSSAAANPVSCSGAASGTFTITNNSTTDTESSIRSNSDTISDVSVGSNSSVTLKIGANVTVDTVRLSSGARMEDTESNRQLVAAGGSYNNLYAVTLGNDKYIYGGSDLSAIGIDAEKAVINEVTATLLGNATNGISYGNSSVALTVELDNHVVTGTGNTAVGIPSGHSGTSLTVQNGTVRGAISAAGASSENCTLTLEKLNMTSNGDAGVGANGALSDGLKLTLTDCTLTSTNDNNMTTGIFFPVEKGVLTIENSTITGYNTGVQAYAGSVTITGEDTVITGSGVSVPNIDDETNELAETGPIFDGSAVSIIDRNTDYGGLTSVKIENGNFRTDASDAEYGAVHIASEVEGQPGTFEKFDNTSSGDKPVQISGGTYSAPVAPELCATDKAPLVMANGTCSIISPAESGIQDYIVQDGTYYENEDALAATHVAKVDDTYYSTMEAAIKAVGSGGIIYVIKDIPNATGISVPTGKDFTIDFGGHTYTLSGPGAGSTNTETNGFQLLKGSDITFKNGTIRIAENANNIKRIIQNYADLTLEDMHIYAENQVGGEEYALSFNNGNIIFKGDTKIITTNTNTIAFDVCYWAEGGYTDGVKVTFDATYTGTINGTIIYDSTDPGKAALTIQGSGYIGAVDTSSGTSNGNNIQISGGSFGESVAEYVVDELNAELNSNGTYTYYKTVDEALACAGPGDQITDLSDQSGEPSDPVTVVTVTYSSGGHGTAPESEKVFAGAKIKLPKMDNEEGYAFRGWLLNGETYQPGEMFQVDESVTFTAQWERLVSGILLDKTILTLYEGERYALTATVMPEDAVDKTVTWNSSNPMIATVDEDGVVTAIRDGSATITATTSSGMSDTCEVIIVERPSRPSRPSGGSSTSSYTVSVEDMENGTVETNPRRAEEGEEVTITVTPDEGYELDTLTVTDRDGDEVEVTEERDGTFTFEMPDSRVTIEVTFVPVTEEPTTPAAPSDWANPYADVAANAWYYDAVAYVTANGLMNGTSATTFAPNVTTTRAMIWTVLARMNGQSVDGGTPWYTLAQSWAMRANVSDGTNPTDPISREELATMLYRAAGSPAVSGNLLSYPDGGAVSAWAESAMLWATQNGIISGIDGMLTPQGQATRAQVATMLMRFREVVIH